MALVRFLQRIVFPRHAVQPSSQSFITLKAKFSTENTQTEGEKRIEEILRQHLDVADVQINDISGGCGSMYEVYVSSKNFKGKRTIQQHRIVNEILKDEVKEMHGLRILTTVPES